VDGPEDSHALWLAFRTAICPVVVVKDGVEGVGTAFHLGNGWMASAAHVPEDVEEAYIPSGGAYRREPEPTELAAVVFHDRHDVCVFRSSSYATGDFEAERRRIHPRPEHRFDDVPLGGHYDDWIDRGMIMLSGVVIGYPPIPLANDLVPVVHDFCISAVIDRYDTGAAAFVLSGVPRGGFSGGPAIVGGRIEGRRSHPPASCSKSASTTWRHTPLSDCAGSAAVGAGARLS
jgi:hypothetical protein